MLSVFVILITVKHRQHKKHTKKGGHKMKLTNHQKTRMEVVWKGVQNSKTLPLFLLHTSNTIFNRLAIRNNNNMAVFKGQIKVQEGTNLGLAVTNMQADTIAIALNGDVEMESGVGGIYTWNTGGYKNTGDQAFIVVRPGAVLRIWGYNRRDYDLFQVMEDGKLNRLAGDVFLDREALGTFADLLEG